MKIYTAKYDTTVSCIYGQYIMKEGNSVPEYIGKLFPQHVIIDEVDDINETKETPKQMKKGK